MKLGVNNSVNPDVKKVGITPMEGKTTKRKAPPQPSKPVEPKAPLGGGKEQQPTEPKVSETAQPKRAIGQIVARDCARKQQDISHFRFRLGGVCAQSRFFIAMFSEGW